MVSWSGPRTGPCSTYLPVPIRAPKPCRWGSVSFLAVFRVGCLAFSTGCFLFWVGFVLGRFIHRSAVHTTCYYYLFFNYMSGGVFQRKN